jgi:hypothetical protein
MYYWIQASPSDFSGTLPQPRRYSSLFLSVSMFLMNFFDRASDFFYITKQWSHRCYCRKIEAGCVWWTCRQEVSLRHHSL